MNGYGWQYRAGQVVSTGRTALTSTESIELRRLFDLVADTCDAGAVALGTPGTPMQGSELQRLIELNVRVKAMVDRIGAILG